MKDEREVDVKKNNLWYSNIAVSSPCDFNNLISSINYANPMSGIDFCLNKTYIVILKRSYMRINHALVKQLTKVCVTFLKSVSI